MTRLRVEVDARGVVVSFLPPLDRVRQAALDDILCCFAKEPSTYAHDVLTYRSKDSTSIVATFREMSQAMMYLQFMGFQ